MVEIHDATPEPPNHGWTKRRVIFLAISGVLVGALLLAVREVLLPFILGIIIAYVLTPLVEFGEKKLRFPRSLSILSVYLVVFGVVGLSLGVMAPRIYDETVAFAREVPKTTRSLAQKHGHRVEKWINAYQATTEQAVPKRKSGDSEIRIQEEEGGYTVELGSGVVLLEEGEGRYRLSQGQDHSEKQLGSSDLVNQGMEAFVGYIQINALQFLKFGQSIVAGFSRGILLLFMTLMVAGYLMHTRESVLSFFRSLPPKMHRPGFDFLLRRMDRGLSGVVRGQLLICVVNGVLSAVGFAAFGLKYWPVLSLLAAVMSIIPIFGSILSTVPAVLIGLTQDVWTALWVLLWILGIHQVEANFLNPKIIGAAAKIHPVLVVFALLAGEHYFGLWGALLAVPALSIAQSVFNHFRYTLPDVEADSLASPEIASR